MKRRWTVLVLVVLGLMACFQLWRAGRDEAEEPSDFFARAEPGEYSPSGPHLNDSQVRMARVTRFFIRFLRTRDRMPPEERAWVLRRLQSLADQALREAPPEQIETLAAFKYPLRRLSEEVASLDRGSPGAASQDRVPDTLPPADGARDRLGGFDNLEEAVYQTVFHDPDFVDPTWALQILQAEAFQDQALWRRLTRDSPDGPENSESQAEVLRQCFTGYVSSDSGHVQMNKALKVAPPEGLEGCTWAEIGYGTGKIFQAVREVVGPDGTILGVELGPGYEAFVRRIMERHPQGWGSVTLVRGSYDDCGLPPESVDVIHEAGVHVGQVPESSTIEPQLAWLASVRRALRPGGILILSDSGSPPIDQVRRIMRKAGFQEYRLALLGPPADPGRPQDFVVSFRKPASDIPR